MSLILDALNKADRERQANEAPPGIHTVHDVQEFKTGKPIWLYLVIATFALTILVLLGFWFMRDNAVPPPAPAPPTPVEQTKKSTSIPGLPKPVLVNKEEPSTVNKSAINELYNKQIEAVENEEPTANVTATQTVDPVNVDNAASKNDEEKQVADTRAAQAVARQEVHKQATPPPAAMDRMSDYPDVGSIGDLPWTIINSMPSLNYSSHIYTQGGQRKQIVINNQAKGEGESLSENIRIEKILKDGAIMEYQGHKFKLNALNSWVNI